MSEEHCGDGDSLLVFFYDNNAKINRMNGCCRSIDAHDVVCMVHRQTRLVVCVESSRGESE